MNIDDAKCIPLRDIFEKLGHAPVKMNENDAWFLAPWRNEKTASLHVNLKMNVWYDHGEGSGGDAINLVCRLLKNNGEDHNVVDALRWVQNMSAIPTKCSIPQEKFAQIPYWTLIKSEPLEDLALTRYLAKRGISIDLAASYVTEAYVRNQENSLRLYAIGLKNEEGGYELRNSSFQSCIAPKAITFIRGQKVKPKGIHIFEGFMDFLTVVTINKQPLNDDVIILNSVSCTRQAIPYIKNYGYQIAFSWLDNDRAGNKATTILSEFFKTEADLRHRPMNKVYAPHKDVNAWHMHNLNLSL